MTSENSRINFYNFRYRQGLLLITMATDQMSKSQETTDIIYSLCILVILAQICFFGVSSLLPLTTPEVETISNKHKSAPRSSINNDFSVRRTYNLHSLKNIGRSLYVNSCLLKLQPGVIKKIRELKINKKRKRGKRGSKTNVRMIKNKNVNTHNLS